jgi:antitoxin CptB
MTDHASRLKRLHYRAWHRGTREADYVVGGFFDVFHTGWGEDELSWFEALIDEQDVDILNWAMGTAEAPARWRGAMMDALRRLDYVDIAG